MSNLPRGSIWSVDRAANGWILIRGIIGDRRYLYYSVREAKRRYRAEVLKNRVVYGETVVYLSD